MLRDFDITWVYSFTFLVCKKSGSHTSYITCKMTREKKETKQNKTKQNKNNNKQTHKQIARCTQSIYRLHEDDNALNAFAQAIAEQTM